MADEDLTNTEERLKKIEIERARTELEQFKKQALEEREKAVEKREAKVEKQKVTPSKLKQKKPFLSFIGLKGIKAGRRKTILQDRIRVLRFQNNLEKLRLKNAINRYKLKNKVELLRRQGKLPIPQVQRIIIPTPYFASPIINRDLDSVYDDINPSPNDEWGDENYFGGETYYDEQFFDSEFDVSPFEQLGIKPRAGVNPLLY